MFAKSTALSVQLVILDYAGLWTNTLDVQTFRKDIKSIREIAIDHGHKLGSINRTEFNDTNIISKFNCRTASARRSRHQ